MIHVSSSCPQKTSHAALRRQMNRRKRHRLRVELRRLIDQKGLVFPLPEPPIYKALG